MQGIGNDFVLIDATLLPPDYNFAAAARTLCDRHVGVGADGLLALTLDRNAMGAVMRMFNPDGTEDMCGNGLRCAAYWSYRIGWSEFQQEFYLTTIDGAKLCRILKDNGKGESTVEVEMNRPLFEPRRIPILLPDGANPLDITLDVAGQTVHLTPVNTGSTHAVIVGPQPTEAEFQTLSPLLERHPAFPEHTSVIWTTMLTGRSLNIRIWERSAGETLGCGTGACAAAAVLIKKGELAPDIPVDVVSKGGALSISWNGGEGPMRMTGAATTVFTGDWPDSAPPIARSQQK